MLLRLLLPLHRSCKNHAVSTRPGSFQALPSEDSSHPHLLHQASHRSRSSAAPSVKADQMHFSARPESSFHSEGLHAGPDNLRAHSLPILPFPRPA